jgi:hypothetical protein
MKKYEINANFIGSLFIDIEADSEEQAKEIFLKNIGNKKNNHGDPYFCLEDVELQTIAPMKFAELNLAFPKKLNDNDIKH